MRFLTGTAIQRAVVSIMSRPGQAMAAVAYWGKRGQELTGLDLKEYPERARIICDLDHVACNPFAIEELLDREIRIKTLPRLHAKVWISGDVVVLGSANASGAALPTDHDDGRANVEAAFEIHGRERAQEVKDWFEARWNDARPISCTALERAKRRWEQAQAGKRKTPPAARSKSGKSGDVGRPELKTWLIDQAAETAVKLNRGDGFDRDFILSVLRRCKQTAEWRDRYARFVGGDVDDPNNPWKKKINPELGKKIREAVGAERILTPGGNPRRKSVRGPDIIGRYTLLKLPSDRSSTPG
ncbi:MAG: hypothetical protein F4Y06_00420 [Rhodospirillales bacterium]|nr:hypothetical protein [Rhodospirillales bacterium]